MGWAKDSRFVKVHGDTDRNPVQSVWHGLLNWLKRAADPDTANHDNEYLDWVHGQWTGVSDPSDCRRYADSLEYSVRYLELLDAAYREYEEMGDSDDFRTWLSGVSIEWNRHLTVSWGDGGY
jgi:hypothetical protein